MKNKTLIIFASVDGQTLKICTYLLNILSNQGQETHIFPIQGLNVKLDSYEKIIIASSIRYGKHHAEIIHLIKENFGILNNKKSAFISVNLVARKQEKNTADTNPYVKKFLATIPWKPKKVGVFAGMLDYSKYSFMDRFLIRLIMVITKGPIFPESAIEYTDWKRVEAFADDFLKL
jgi:menaquinone-dependent protoporphyrinogen oxidase